MQNHTAPINHNSCSKKFSTYDEHLSQSTARWILLLILILGASLRVVLVDANDFWYDELFTLSASQIPIKVLLYITPRYTAPPLFYILLKGWLALTEQFLHPRVFSVLWGLGGIYLTYLLGRRLLGREVGLLSALLVALSPFHIRYSLELRMYIMQTTLLTAETLILLSALRKGTILRWCAYGLLLALNLAIKYQSVFYCFSEIVFLLLYAFLSGRRQLLRNIIIAIGIGIIFLSPVIWLGVQQLFLADFSLTWVPPPQPMDLLRCFFITFIYYMIAFNESWWMWALSTLLVGTILIFNVKQWKGQKERVALMLLVCLGILPPVIMYAISIAGFRIFFLVRYVIISLIPFSILLGAGILKIRWRALRYTTLIILLLILMGTSLIQSLKPWTPSWSTLTSLIDTYVKNHDLLLANPINWLIGYYYYSERKHPAENFKDVFNDPERNPDRFYLFQTNAVDESGVGFPGYLPLVLKEFGKQRILFRDDAHTLAYYDDVDFKKFRAFVRDEFRKRKELEQREDFMYTLFADDNQLNNNYFFSQKFYDKYCWVYREFTRETVPFEIKKELTPGYYQLRLRALEFLGPEIPPRDVTIKVDDIASLRAEGDEYLFWYYSVPFQLREQHNHLRIEVSCPLVCPADYVDTKDIRKIGLRFYWLILAQIDLDKYRRENGFTYYYDIGTTDTDGICIGSGVYPYIEHDLGEGFRWTNGKGNFFFIIDKQDIDKVSELILNLRQNHPDPAYNPEIKIFVNEQPAGTFIVGKAFEDYVIKDIRPMIHNGINRLKILSPYWIPKQVLPVEDDRKLGVQVNYIALR